MSRLFPSLACVSSMVVAVTLAGCAASDETDDSATGASSAYSNDPAAALDVPRFPKDSLAGRGNARMTVAYGDGAFESFDEGEARVVIALEPERWPHTLIADQGARGRLLVQLGTQSEALRAGTYSCADADGRVRLANLETGASTDASACRIVIDEIYDRQLPDAVRVHGRFEAATDPSSPFASSRVRGAFVADLVRGS